MGDVANTGDIQTTGSADVTWEQTLQNIVTHGATRMFDTLAAVKLYDASKQQPIYSDGLGNIYRQGTALNQGALAGIPAVAWLAVAAVVAVLVLKD